MELRSRANESNWSKRLFNWLKLRQDNNESGCQLGELLHKAQEFQDCCLLQNPEVDKLDLNAGWLYNWSYENEIIMKATKELPLGMKLEDVFLHYVVCFNNSSKFSLGEDKIARNLHSSKRLKRSSRSINDGLEAVTSTPISFERSAPLSSVNSKNGTVHGIDAKSSEEQAINSKKRAGKKLISTELDRELWDWYAECKSRGRKVSVDIVRARARLIFGKAGHKNFKASEGWYRKWLRRWKKLQERVTSSGVDQPFPVISKTTAYSADRTESNKVTEMANFDENRSNLLLSSHLELDTMMESRSIANPAMSIQGSHDLEIPDCNVRQDHAQHLMGTPLNKDMEVRNIRYPVVETLSTGLDFMDVDFSLTSRSSDQVTSALTSNFVPCLDGAEISGLTLPSVDDDSAGVIMSCLNMSSDALDLPVEFISVDRDLRNSRLIHNSCEVGRQVAPANNVNRTHLRNRNMKRIKGRTSGPYQDDFKREVISYALTNNSFKKAAIHYGVHHATVSQWCRDKQMSEEIDNKVLAANCHRTEPPDKRFIDWMRECRLTGVELDRQRVRTKAEQLIASSNTSQSLDADHNSSCQWFFMWMKRWTDVVYEEGMENEIAIGKVSKNRRSSSCKNRTDRSEISQLIHYPPTFKAEVSTYAELHGNSWTAHVFNISRKRVTDWIASKDRQPLKAGRKVASSDAEKQIWEWYLGRRAVGRRPNGNELREKAAHVFAAFGLSNVKCSSGWLKCFCNRFGVKLRNTNDDDVVEWVLEQFDQNLTVTHTDLQIQGVSVISKENPNFKASAGWSIRFCRRHPKLLGEVATVDTPLPQQLEDRVNGFRLWIRNVLQQNGLMLAAIGCMDEVSLTFGVSSTSSKDETQRKSRQPLIRRTGLENASAVVCLAILADGGVLPSLILIRRTNQDFSEQNIHDKQHVFFMDELKVTEDILQKWMDEIWLRHVPSPALLIFDGFEPHIALRSSVIASGTASRGGGHDVAVIPGSCSSKLQPLDVYLRTAFVECVNDAYLRWKRKMTASGTLLKSTSSPSASDILNFVAAGHRLVCQKQEIVRRSFVVTGITTASDGSQDHLVDDVAWAVAEM